MWKRKTLLTSLVWALSLSLLLPLTSTADQILATVGGKEISASELQSAIASSPFYTQFNTMGEDE